jgi:hypothetical protein
MQGEQPGEASEEVQLLFPSRDRDLLKQALGLVMLLRQEFDGVHTGTLCIGTLSGNPLTPG